MKSKKANIKLLKKLISITSFVDKENNEKELGEYIFSYLKRYLPWFKISKQNLGNRRFNIIASDNKSPSLVFISHMDTVMAAKKIKKETKPILKNNKLIGLGSADMKSGLAASIIAAQNSGSTKGLTLIFDCDEEYYFKGIKKVTNEYNFRPKLSICPEPTDLKIINGCRGIVELEMDILGTTAHAAQPKSGINAIEKSLALVQELRKTLTTNDLIELGKTTVNLSYLKGGKNKNNKVSIQANAIPDLSKILLDIRVANSKLNAKKIRNKIIEITTKNNVEIENFQTKLDLAPYLSKRSNLRLLEKVIEESLDMKAQYLDDLSRGGFNEAAFIANAWKSPAVCFGPGPANMSHKEGEYVNVDTFQKTIEVFTNLINRYCK